MATKVASRTVTVAMAIAGRGARACDVCAGKSASWYCGADAAYLCDRCDTQVHSANSLSLRHERVRLTPSGTPRKPTTSSPPPRKRSMSKILDASPIPHVLPSRKRSRTTRPHPHHRRQQQQQQQEQQLPKPPNPELAQTILPKQSCEPEDHHQPLTFDDLFDTEDFFAADDTQEVPSLISGSPSYSSSFDIFSPDFHAVSSPSEDSNLAVFFKGKAAHDDDAASEHFLVPVHELDAGIDPLSCDTDGGISLPGEVCFIPGDIPDLTGFEDFGSRELGSLSFDLELPSDETGSESSPKSNVEKTESDRIENGPFAKYFASRPKPETMAQQLSPEEIKSEAKEILRCCREGQDPGTWPGLQLNYEDIVTAWADRGEPWVHPDGLVPSSGEDDAGREARVLRYKEKRRNRLFSKTIRYEVRKVNAERRPRMKGRFVKRNNQS